MQKVLEQMILYSIYYNSKTLKLVNKRNLVLGLTQENSIENSVQNCLPYILKLHSPACCGNHQIQDLIITQVVKLSVKQSSEKKHKRTQQKASAKLESYLYYYRLVHATTSYLPYVLLKTTMCTLCALISSSRFFYYVLGL